MNRPSRSKVIDALHRSRMRPYLDAARQNERNALALYLWHADLTAAVQTVLSATEVILRNAMDRELQAWNNRTTGGSQSWLLFTPEAPLRSLSAGKRTEAKNRAEKEYQARDDTHYRYGISVSHDDVLAQLMFGVWKDLLPNHQQGAGSTTENANRERLWREALCLTFPNVSDPDGSTTFWRVFHLHHLRNRVSHMEPLLNIDVKDRIDVAFALLRSIDVDVANWVTGSSRVSIVLKQRPNT